MERSLRATHPDILDRVALHLPLSSRLRLTETCRSMRSRTLFRRGKSQLENLSSSALHKVMRCMPFHADRLRLGAVSWTLRKWTIQSGLLTLRCDKIEFLEERFAFIDDCGRRICTVPFRPFQDVDLPIRVAARAFALITDFSRAHIDRSIRRLSAFRPPLRPETISLCDSDTTLDGRSDDPTAVRRLVEHLGGTTRPFSKLWCITRRDGTLLLESDFLHRVQARDVYLRVDDIGPDGLDFAVEDSAQRGTQLRAYPHVDIYLKKREHLMDSPTIVFNSLLRFMRAHFSPSLNVRFKYDVYLHDWSAHGSATIRALADECGIQLGTSCDEKEERLQFKTSSNPTRRIVSVRWTQSSAHAIFVGADKEPWWLSRM